MSKFVNNSIVGLSWRKLRRSLDYEPMDDNKENGILTPVKDIREHDITYSNTPVTRSQSKRNEVAESELTNGKECGKPNRKINFSLSKLNVRPGEAGATKSFRVAMDIFKQKIKKNTHRRKRLTIDPACSPYTTRLAQSSLEANQSSLKRSSSKTPPVKEPKLYPRTSYNTTPKSEANSEVKMYSPFFIDTPSKTPSRIKMGIHPPRRCPSISPGQLEKDLAIMTEGVETLAKFSEDWSANANDENQSPRFHMKTRSVSQSDALRLNVKPKKRQTRRSLGSNEIHSTNSRPKRSMVLNNSPVYV